MQDSVAVWGDVPKVTLAGRVQVRPAGVEADTDRLTVPVNPLRAVKVIVEVPEEPARIWAGVTALGEIEKSGVAVTLNVMLAVVWDNVPLVPVTVTT